MGMLDWFKSPPEIDPDKVYDMMSSDHTATLSDRANQMIDPDSPLMMMQKNAMTASAQDSLAASNRNLRNNMASTGMGGQSGILNQLTMQNDQNVMGNVNQAYNEMLANNLGQSNQLVNQAAGYDMQARDAMASAYGQNITNKANYNASMAGNVMDLATTFIACDAKIKKNIKKVGSAKMKNGKSTGIYEYTYKGHNKKHTGIIAQDVQNNMPDAVKKGQNGRLYVDINKVF